MEKIDQGIEILTGLKAGQRDEPGDYPQETIHYLVNQRLQVFAERMKDFSSGD